MESTSTAITPELTSSDDGSSTSSIPGHSDGPPVPKKRKSITGKFKHSWNLPPYICESSKGSMFAYCQLCSSHFTVSHGGLNDVKRHIDGSGHQQRFNHLKAIDSNLSHLTL